MFLIGYCYNVNGDASQDCVNELMPKSKTH